MRDTESLKIIVKNIFQCSEFLRLSTARKMPTDFYLIPQRMLFSLVCPILKIIISKFQSSGFRSVEKFCLSIRYYCSKNPKIVPIGNHFSKNIGRLVFKVNSYQIYRHFGPENTSSGHVINKNIYSSPTESLVYNFI